MTKNNSKTIDKFTCYLMTNQFLYLKMNDKKAEKHEAADEKKFCVFNQLFSVFFLQQQNSN